MTCRGANRKARKFAHRRKETPELRSKILLIVLASCIPATLLAQPFSGCDQNIGAVFSIDEGHPWQPPFGLDRIGQPPIVRVDFTTPENSPVREYSVVGYAGGKELERHGITIALTNPPPYLVPFSKRPNEVGLLARCQGEGELQLLARQTLHWPEFEMDAEARPNQRINPVDLGTVLVPHDWLLLAGGQSAEIEVAALSHDRELRDGRLRAWFKGGQPVETPMPIVANTRVVKKMRVPLDVAGDRSVLYVRLTEGERVVWSKEIRTMIAGTRPPWPSFGVVETKLRYDAPISIRDPKTGELSSLNYDTAWDPKLNDVVVFLPNGSRFVFWRGSSYVPFWAGTYNTGFNYQWVETSWRDSVDVAEPLMDKELRYGRVRILEATKSRVHVRWSYEVSDFEYKVWGDQVSEDFYFYPDGFGTRVVTLTSPLNNASYYSLSEAIILAPQAAYPLDVLPEIKIDLLTLDGGKQAFVLPRDAPGLSSDIFGKLADERQPTMYRFSTHKNDAASAIYFSPHSTPISLYGFVPFYDRGRPLTPAYWGEHWPLARGSMTGSGISDRIRVSPSHISIAAWLLLDERGKYVGPERPLISSSGQAVDSQGRPRVMNTQQWTWMIAHTDLADESLRDWAKSFSFPPAVELIGARLNHPVYSLERRSLRIIAEQSSLTIRVEPQTRTVNPVFEIDQAPKEVVSVSLGGKSLPTHSYAWDGKVLWTKGEIGTEGATVLIQFR